MKKSLVVVTLLAMSSFCFAGSIILPFWQNDGGEPIYSMFVILNTSSETGDLVNVQYYGKTGNPQAGTMIEKTIPAMNQEIFGSGDYPGELKVPTGDPLGYAVAYDTGGMLVAIGIVYDGGAHAGYPISCFPGDDDGQATGGW